MDRYLFADEAGCFTFNRNPNVSKYFIICTITTPSLDLAAELAILRHELIREGHSLGDCFHATADAQAVRDRVYETLCKHDFHVQATVCEKSKAQPQVRTSKARFYQYPWFYHFKHGIAPHVQAGDRLIVTAASIGTKKERDTFTNAIKDVMNQSIKEAEWIVDFRPCLADPCLQVADYCAWAIQRKWERNDSRSFDLIADRVTYHYELWRKGTVEYY